MFWLTSFTTLFSPTNLRYCLQLKYSGPINNSEESNKNEENPTKENQMKPDNLNSVELGGGTSTLMDCENAETDSNKLEHQNMVSELGSCVPTEDPNILKESLISRGVQEENSNPTGCNDIEMEEAELTQEPASLMVDVAKSVLLCRLCAIPCQDSASVFLFRHPPHNPEVVSKNMSDAHDEEAFGDILSMIKATLPIKVSILPLSFPITLLVPHLIFICHFFVPCR